MKTTATKLSVLAFLGLGLAVYGQSGKVGVNISSPRATLDVQPSATNSQGDAKTNEGILAPQLSKTRVASIEAPVEGTLVYVIDDATKTNGAISNYTGNDTKVAKITEKGYYYYNGTEWVKSAANSPDQEWVYNSSTKNIELKRSGSLSFPNSVFYTKKGEFRNLDPGDKYWFDTFSQTERSASNSDQLLGDFSRYSLDVKSSNIIVPDSVQPDSWGNIGSKSFSTTTLFDAVPNRMTYYDNLSSGIYLPQFLNNVGSLKNIDAASFNITNNSNNTFIETILSTKNTSIIGKNASSDNLYGSTNLARSYSDKDHKRIIGNVNTAQLYGTNSSKIKIVAGSRNNVVFDNKSNTSVDLLMGQYIMFDNLNGSSPKIKDAVGVFIQYFNNNVGTSSTIPSSIEKAYGIKIDNIKEATENYSIYTDAGTVRFGDKVGVGIDAPTEMVEVAGNVKATGFIGANAAIFPDYVFQKYYTGTSSLKADYSFKTLSQVEDFVKTNGHLPGYQSAEAIKKQGYIDLMATQLTNVEKIEELYLHLLEKDKEVKALKAEITELKSLVKDLLAK